MTKRILFAVALVSALATAAGATQGRVAVVYPNRLTEPNASDNGTLRQMTRNLNVLTNILDELAVPYFLLPGDQAKVEQLRLGVIGRGAQVDTVAGVIHASFIGNRSYSGYAGYRGDSLTRVARGGVEVPHLFLADNLPMLNSTILVGRHLQEGSETAARRCSTGVTGDKINNYAPDGQGYFWYGDQSMRLQPGAYTYGWYPADPPPAGGFRKLLGMSSSGHSIKRYHGSNAKDKNYNAQWPDSMPFLDTQAADTVVVWERPWNIATLPNAKPMVFCDWFGVGAMDDSMSNANSDGKPVCEGDIRPLLVALARFDSLCGGIVGKSADAAITVQGSLSRGLRRWNRGIAPGDTAVFYSSLDSLKAWGVPVTFYGNVNPDSATAYARDVIKLKEVSQAKFAPQVWDGVADSTVGGLLAYSGRYGNPRDIFGKYAVRAVYGDGSATGADSSAWTQLRIARALRDSIFGISRGSRSLRAPLDDWDFIGKNTKKCDSLLWVLPQVGFDALIVDGRPSLRGSPGGSFKRQQSYLSQISGSRPVKLLAHQGGMLSGGQWQQTPWDSSSVVAPLVGMDVTEQDVDRAFASIFLNGHKNFDLWRYDDQLAAGWRGYLDVRNENEDFFVTTFPGHGSIVNLSCASLSGDPANPARSGLWVIKSLWQTSEITRRMSWGGRRLLNLTYPEYVRP